MTAQSAALRTYSIIGIPGDGVGPELLHSATAVLRAIEARMGGFRVDVERHSAGALHYLQTGRAMDPETVEACRRSNAVLKAPVGLPEARYADGTGAGLLGDILRPALDTYANVRPIQLWDGVRSPLRLKPGQVNYVIVRENTEGFAASQRMGVSNNWGASDILFVTRPGVERVVRFAFELARKRPGAPKDAIRRVTCVGQSNVLKTFVLWLRIFNEIGEALYPDIEREHMSPDACAQAMVMEPDRFDVLVMENLLGDILSDLGGGTVGGVGMCPAANIGDGVPYFEPIHGSAPSIAGQNKANPIGQILAMAMMLDRLGEEHAGEAVRRAVGTALRSKELRIDPAGRPRHGTTRATEAVISHL